MKEFEEMQRVSYSGMEMLFIVYCSLFITTKKESRQRSLSSYYVDNSLLDQFGRMAYPVEK